MKTDSFKKILTRYKTIFFDAYGVLKNHQGLLPGVSNTFDFLQKNGIDFFILTNDASRSPLELANGYQAQGLKQITESKIISSGMLAREYLQLKVKSGLVAYLGTENSAHYIETSGLKTISIKQVELDSIDEISALVLLDDEGFDWNEDLNKTVNLLRHKNIPVIVSNTDTSYPISENEVGIAIGGLANMIETIVGKNFLRFGKPDAQMFSFAYQHAIVQNSSSHKEEILMVGDTLSTDILGGNKFGLDTALMLTGNTQASGVEMQINSLGISPTYICHSAGLGTG